MLKRIFSFLIPRAVQDKPELFRRYRLIVGIILITVLFDFDYGFTTLSIRMDRAIVMLFIAAIIHLLLLILIRKNVSLFIVTNIYVLTGVSAIVVSVVNSGGFDSPVLPWLATSPIMALLMDGRKTGVFWLVVNMLLIFFFAFSDKLGIHFVPAYDISFHDNLLLNCVFGLIMIIFFVSLVFENGKNVAMKKLEENSLLLSEEKRKNALHQVSQEIHDGVGQTLSIIKLNLHLLSKGIETLTEDKLRETVDLASKAIQDLRNISNNLYAENLSEFDLGHAVLGDIGRINKSGSLRAKLDIIGSPYLLEPRTAFVLYMVTKEAVNNALKHSQGSEIVVRLDFGDNFSLSVSDDGIGYKRTFSGSSGQGVMSMKNRMALLGGSFEIEDNPNGGACLKVSLMAEKLPVLNN
ncbi:sensor histidine kinase [Pedobacter sp. 22163]|uniref:sensor histidine kinase n=1 Tax=Pedobacter sp. 22163 TaxID=3453883 RepID=UPI003F87994C